MALAGLILFSVLFFATHILLSHDPLRANLIEKLGAKGFQGVYSLVSFITLGGAIWIFAGHRNAGPILWSLLPWVLPLVYLLMLAAFFLLVHSFITPSPTGMMTKSMEPRGILRITRHPMNMGFACFGLAHILANGALGDVFFFGSLFAVGFVGAYHQDRRKVRELGEPFAAFCRQTGVLPLEAILKGRTSLVAGEFKAPGLVLSLAAFLAVAVFHRALFGVPPL